MPNTFEPNALQNASVARAFDDIADCLEVAGDNPFKIRAYRRAAESVREYPEPIQSAADAGTLHDIEGLGDATAAKVQEFLATGQMRLLQHLREEYPPSLLELLRVPGLGPKRVRVLRDQGVSTLDELKVALSNNTLKMGKGFFTPRTIQDIKAGLERLAHVSERLPLPSARRVGHDLLRALRDASKVRVEVSGSLRRGCDTIGNINLVAQSGHADEVLRAFETLPGLSLESRGENESATARADGAGVQVHLQIASSNTFGAAWLRASGASHWEQLQTRADNLGLQLLDDGLWRDSQRVAKSEEEIYNALQMQFVPPELREGRGEVSAASENRLPSLINVQDLRGDLHSHSTWSDGSVSIHGMAHAMQARGYEYFCVTDHSKVLAMANGLNAERLRAQALEIAEVQAEFPAIKILRGIECDILRDGSLDLDDEILSELDFVIASVHSAFSLDEATQTARMIQAITHPLVRMVAHPTGRILGGRPPYAVDVAALIAAARETGTVLEINASERLDLKDEHAFAAREAGVMLCINTDAHSLRMLDNMNLGITVARRAWCESKDVLNTKSRDELMAWLGRG